MFSEELEKIDWEETTKAIYSKTESDVLRALGKEHCDVDDFMALISPAAAKYLEPMAQLSKKYTEERFGKTISMFIPLYITNSCTNSCVYCGFHISNPMARTILTPEQIEDEYKAIKKLGPFENLLLVTGENPAKAGVPYLAKALDIAKKYFSNLKIEVMPLKAEEYAELKKHGLNGVICFQETYNKKSYEELHPTGPKHNYDYHTEAMDRAMQGGIDDVGLGVLFGLELYRYEFAGLLMHAEHLEAVHGVGPHTISVPRVKHADDIDPTAFDNGISDDIFAKICALIRISVPYTGMIISTRESQAVREKVLPLGVSQISGASRTSVGGYAEPEPEEENSEQFDVSDQRTLDEVVNWLMKMGYIPSFCTACYREGRTGDRFMALCKNMQILNCCHPNALMTLKEYLEDYAGEETKKIGMELIDRELEKIPNPKVKQTAYEHIHDIAEGKRDFRF